MAHHLNDSPAEGYKIFLQSKDATILQDDGSTAFFFLNKVLMPPTPDLNMMVGIVDCEIPVSYYNINQFNNQITINNNAFTLEPKNYNAFDIQDELNNKLTASSVTVVVEFNQQSNKFKFLYTGLEGNVTINSGSLCSYLGFTVSQLGVSSSSLEGQNCCNLGGTSNIYVSSNFTINNLNSNGQYSGVLSKVLTDAPSGAYIFYQPSEIQYHVVGNTSVSNIIISLRDDELNIIDFNGLTFSITLSIQFSYKRSIKDFDHHLLNDTAIRQDEKNNIKQ